MTIHTLVNAICTAIVGSDFRVGVYEGSATVLIEIFAKPPYIAFLIGREGQMVRALRVIAAASGMRDGVKVYLPAGRGIGEVEMTTEEHRTRHERLHRSFDELLADWIGATGGLPSKSTVLELMEWSYQQTQQLDHASRGGWGDTTGNTD